MVSSKREAKGEMVIPIDISRCGPDDVDGGDAHLCVPAIAWAESRRCFFYVVGSWVKVDVIVVGEG